MNLEEFYDNESEFPLEQFNQRENYYVYSPVLKILNIRYHKIQDLK